MDTSSGGLRTGRREPLRLSSAAALEACREGLAVAVARLRAAGFSLCPPVQVWEWSGDTRYGSFVQIDATTWALHIGRGVYLTVDIQRDLNGVTPREAIGYMLCRSGTVRVPDHLRSYNAM